MVNLSDISEAIPFLIFSKIENIRNCIGNERTGELDCYNKIFTYKFGSNISVYFLFVNLSHCFVLVLCKLLMYTACTRDRCHRIFFKLVFD